ncbi:MAG: DNA cytosine methyltransferase [Thermomicrobiales bacterium]
MVRSIELFTGAGGLALGLHRAGFHHTVVIEREHNACDTLRLNHERHAETGIEWNVREADVSAITYFDYGEGIDLLAGGPPCQPFSLGGKHAGEADTRNMFPQFVRAVRELRPRAFLLENVKGLTRQSFRPYFDYITGQLTLPNMIPAPGEPWEDHWQRLIQADESDTLRYDVQWQLFNVADFGVPQERHRVFIVGFRHDLGAQWAFPEPTHSADALLYAQYVDGSYWDEHGIERRPPPHRLLSKIARLAARGELASRRWRTVRDAIRDLPDPINFTRHDHYDNHVGIPDARSYPGHTGSPWDWPAKTIKAGDHGNPGGENTLRYDDDSVRYFTVRELARLQTFPDEWHFANSWTESRRQLGNAVPVAMAEALGRRIKSELQRVHSSSRTAPRELVSLYG